MPLEIHTTSSAEETETLGREIGKRVLTELNFPKVLFFHGDLGAGKTTFLRGFAQGLGIQEPLTSPTFALVQEYELPENELSLHTFAHFDLYRADDKSALGMPEVVEVMEDKGTVVAIEWAEKLGDVDVVRRVGEVRIERGEGEEKRELIISFS